MTLQAKLSPSNVIKLNELNFKRVPKNTHMQEDEFENQE